nr:hypothetical protein [Rhodoferax sp.]
MPHSLLPTSGLSDGVLTAAGVFELATPAGLSAVAITGLIGKAALALNGSAAGAWLPLMAMATVSALGVAALAATLAVPWVAAGIAVGIAAGSAAGVAAG